MHQILRYIIDQYPDTGLLHVHDAVWVPSKIARDVQAQMNMLSIAEFGW